MVTFNNTVDALVVERPTPYEEIRIKTANSIVSQLNQSEKLQKFGFKLSASFTASPLHEVRLSDGLDSHMGSISFQLSNKLNEEVTLIAYKMILVLGHCNELCPHSEYRKTRPNMLGVMEERIGEIISQARFALKEKFGLSDKDSDAVQKELSLINKEISEKKRCEYIFDEVLQKLKIHFPNAKPLEIIEALAEHARNKPSSLRETLALGSRSDLMHKP